MITHRDIVTIELDKFWNEQEYEKPFRVLELGGGNNGFEKYFKNKKPNCVYDSVCKSDDEDMCDMNHLCDNFYDLVFACHCFEHVERPINALKEMLRVLKPGGKIFIATPYPNKHHILDCDKDHIFVLNTLQMNRLLIYAGFIDIKVYVQKSVVNENNWNVISIASKKED